MAAEGAVAVPVNLSDGTEDEPSWVEAVGTNHAERCMAMMGCQRLLRAQLATGAHWIRDPQQLAALRASLGLPQDPV